MDNRIPEQAKKDLYYWSPHSQDIVLGLVVVWPLWKLIEETEIRDKLDGRKRSVEAWYGSPWWSSQLCVFERLALTFHVLTVFFRAEHPGATPITPCLPVKWFDITWIVHWCCRCPDLGTQFVPLTNSKFGVILQWGTEMTGVLDEENKHYFIQNQPPNFETSYHTLSKEPVLSLVYF